MRPLRGVDPGVLAVVEILRELGCDTFASCSGRRADHPPRAEGDDRPQWAPPTPWNPKPWGPRGWAEMRGWVTWANLSDADLDIAVSVYRRIRHIEGVSVKLAGPNKVPPTNPHGPGPAHVVIEVVVREADHDALDAAMGRAWDEIRDALAGVKQT
jgi:hypothetical protein